MPAALTLAMCMDLSLLASLSRLPCLVMRFQSLELARNDVYTWPTTKVRFWWQPSRLGEPDAACAHSDLLR
jgi:hypothetical protein